ncbi:hypothetical protein SAMN02745126_02009 [Enhydrobacter aerosaccus]|uniref:Uncharacterized protein n=1 Tax=Enhydrobacter aerosaccus TaxID=225324 RepID=A0A1T4MXU8_9HYPH|nr:hypothetical protein [Enhydrobacter aerosaccus]SJZ71617.1 hypothetical protein SAMN02745126_02009 [Enhydrobacter aerosaccus]
MPQALCAILVMFLALAELGTLTAWSRQAATAMPATIDAALLPAGNHSLVAIRF